MKIKFLLIIVAIITLLSFPNVNFAQAPDLGSAANFALFTTVGAVSNSGGVSKVTGDVGSNDGDVTGFDGIGGVVYTAGGVTAQCSTDLQSAYNQLNSTVATLFPGPLLGSGQILTAGVYSIPQAASLTLGLTFDAETNPNAIFIIKIQGAFSTAASAKIYLINGASSNNIYWQVEGAVYMGAGTFMKGTIIANNAAITLAAGDTLEGRALSTTGAISMDGSVVYIPGSIVILPFNLLSFKGICEKQYAVLRWNTGTETKNNYFNVERSAEGINWQVIATVEGAGGSSFLHEYSFADKLPGTAISHYRLKQTDFNGIYKYGQVVLVKNCGANSPEILTLYPNPSNGKFRILFTGDIGQVYSTKIFNSIGEKMYESNGFQSNFDLSNKTPGMYFLQVHLYSNVLNRIIIVKKMIEIRNH